MALNIKRAGAATRKGEEQQPGTPSPTADRLTEAELERHRPRTIAGKMAEILLLQSEDRAKLNALTAKFEHFVNAEPARLLDPRCIRPCPWGGRPWSPTSSSLDSELTSSIEARGVNVQPIKVRRLAPGEESAAAGRRESTYVYELVFGWRRLRGCESLGLQVYAVISSMEPREAFIESMIEKQGTSSPLSPYDMGVMLKWALETQLFPSQRSLTNQLGTPAREVEKAITIASLPVQFVRAFPAPADIRSSWAERLASAVQFDEEGAVAKAQALCDRKARLTALEVFRQLCEN